MEKRFDSIDKRLDDTATKDSLDQLQNAVDAYAKKVDDYTQRDVNASTQSR